MKKVLTPIITLIFVSFIAANVFCSDYITKTYDFKNFNSIDVSSGMYLHVTKSDTYSIKVKVDESDFKYLRVKKDGETLKIYFHNSFFSFFSRHNRVEINVTMPALRKLDLSGGTHGNIEMDNSGKSFYADMSGGTYLEGNLTCGDVHFDISGGSKVNINGKGNDLKIEGSGGCSYKLKDFSVNNVDADLSGGTGATITMNGTLNADLSGGCHITYYGKMSLGNTDFSGGSGVSRGN